MNKEFLAIYNKCTHVFTYKEDNYYSVYYGDDNLLGWFDKKCKTLKEAKQYIKETYPNLIFYRAN